MKSVHHPFDITLLSKKASGLTVKYTSGQSKSQSVLQ